MAEPLRERYGKLLSAVGHAARAHRHQVRKDGQTPYVAHVFRVCLIARHVFGIDDPEVLTTAMLHDTIEDTTTDRDDLSESFGPLVAHGVGMLSKDSRLPEVERERVYMAVLAEAPEAVVVCKLADMFDNLIDSRSLSAEKRRKTLAKTAGYLSCLKPALTALTRGPFGIVEQLLSEESKSEPAA